MSVVVEAIKDYGLVVLVVGVIAGITIFMSADPVYTVDPVRIQAVNKLVVNMHELAKRGGSEYYLIAEDGSTCRVSMETFVVTHRGDSFKGMWEELE